MNVQLSDVFDVVRSAWTLIVGFDIEPSNADESEADESAISAYVRISGAWNGILLLECPAELARHVAAELFDIDLSRVQAKDMRCAVSYLVQTISRGMKTIVLKGCCVSLPAVPEDQNQWTALRGTWPLGQIHFRCNRHVASIVLAQDIGTLAAAA